MNEYDLNRIYDPVKNWFIEIDNYEDANRYLLNTRFTRDKAKDKVYHEIGREKKFLDQKTYGYNYRL